MDTQALVAMRIQQLCAEHGYNLNQLARSCGVPPSTVKNIIHGASHNPGIVTIKLLCDGSVSYTHLTLPTILRV